MNALTAGLNAILELALDDEDVMKFVSMFYWRVEWFDENHEKLSWWHVCANESLPVSFFADNTEHLIWSVLVANRAVPLAFFADNHKRLEWYSASRNLPITVEFAERFKSRIVVDELRRNYNVTPEALLLFFKWEEMSSVWGMSAQYRFDNDPRYVAIEPDMRALLATGGITDSRLRAVDILLSEKPMAWKVRRLMGGNIPARLMTAFVTTHPHDVCWGSVSRNPYVEEVFLEEHLEKLVWSEVARNQAISMAFIGRHLDRLPIKNLAENHLDETLVEELFDKFKEARCVYTAVTNIQGGASQAFIERHAGELNLSFMEYGGVRIRHVTQDFIEKTGLDVQSVYINADILDAGSFDPAQHPALLHKVVRRPEFWRNTRARLEHADRMIDITAEVAYAPGGAMYLEAMTHFATLIAY